MNTKWNRRDFLKRTGTAGLAVYATGIPLTGLLSSCSKATLATATDTAVSVSALTMAFQSPPEAARPWVLWHWMKASFSKAGITADLEAMKEAGIGGAYLMPIKPADNPPLLSPPIHTLSPEWWDMVKHALNEAERLGLKIGMHACDGFAVAGGPWITPELSMQKVVWTEAQVKGGSHFNSTLAQPETIEGFYKDIAVLAYPTPEGAAQTTYTTVPKVTTSVAGTDAQFLVTKDNKKTFNSKDSCWIQYTFDKPFTCRSIKIITNGNNHQAHRLLIQASDDGRNFRDVEQLEPARHGWQDYDANSTHVITPTTARYFRFVYDKEGTEPGAEDLEAAKWKPVLKVSSIELSSTPRIHQYEGKTGEVWRVSRRTTVKQVPDALCVQPDKIIDITKYLDASGRLTWNAPAGNWTILRIGHTSTGHKNYIGGAAVGLECDKFNPEAARLQFDNWFGEAVRQAGPELASRILKMFFIDSWEAGSQNWSPVFREEFKRRRGYDLFTYLPAMAGVPVQSADVSERFLHDVRQTIAELINDNFFVPIAELAHAKSCTFTAENTAPTMVGDGMLHYKTVDVPMGEFWYNSPTHDKPNDMLDAISGAHIYGKPIVQAEAFTTVRMDWSEHPGALKTMGDRNYALGINRFVYHVFVHNPWTDRKPGMTLDGVGLYFQRDQTWWKPGRAWVDYARRCQALLQQGRPVADIAVFTGEELPRRALMPDRLLPSLPGIFGADAVVSEVKRLANEGQPLRQKPTGVTLVENMSDAEDWIDPLRGYAYDSINRDALLRLAKVNNGRIELPGGASYGILVLPAKHQMTPDNDIMTPEVANRLRELVEAGATIIIHDQPMRSPSLQNYPANDQALQQVVQRLWDGQPEEVRDKVSGSFQMHRIGKGRVIKGPYQADSFATLGIERDIIMRENSEQQAREIAWIHRTEAGVDIYFISNQQAKQRTLELSLRTAGRIPELLDPVTGEVQQAGTWRTESGRTILPLQLPPNGSLFVVLQQPTEEKGRNEGKNWVEPAIVQSFDGPWQVTFDPEFGGPAKPVIFNQLQDWSKHSDFNIRHYSGTAVYSKTFNWKTPSDKPSRVWLDLGHVANIAEVKLNGVSCGVAWTAPYRVDINKALKSGDNELTIEVSNTWANRLIGDQTLPEAERVTKTTAPFRLEGKPLLEAGLLGPVTIQKPLENKQS